MSELRAATVSDLAGTGPTTLTGQTAAKAWCNFNGSGTVTVRGSANLSSLVDNGTGDYSQNFINALTDANFASVGMVGAVSTYRLATGPQQAPTTTSFRLVTINTAGTLLDIDYVSLVFVR